MNPVERIRIGLKDPWLVVYLRVLAVFLVLGAMVHLGSILGVGGTPWMTRPIQFRIADPLLLAFNLVVGWGLWRKSLWAVVAWIVGVVFLQLLPITFFMDAFASDAAHRRALQGLLATNVVVLGIFFLLLFRKRKR